jgi:hypothetical protein
MKKSTGRQYIELFYSLQIINDSLSLISLGKKYHVIPIAGQLRAILIKDKQTPVPLYYAIQKILEVKQCIYLSTIPEKIKISKDCECYFNVMNVSLERDKLHYQKEDIGKWLQYCIVETPQKSFTIEEVIKIVANKNGGAHYNEEISNDAVLLYTVTDEKHISIIDKIIVNIALIIKALGLLLIKKAFDFHYLANIAIRFDELSSHKNIISYHDEDYYLPVAILLTSKRQLILKITDPDRRLFIVPLKENIEKKGIYTICFSYEINSNFESELKIYSLFDQTAKYILTTPIYVHNHFTSFPHQWWGDEHIEMGFYNLQLYTSVLPEIIIIKKMKDMEVDENTPMVILKGRNYAYVDKKNNLCFGSIKCSTFNDL